MQTLIRLVDNIQMLSTKNLQVHKMTRNSQALAPNMLAKEINHRSQRT